MTTGLQPRGLRNNNPGNIRFDGTKWQGLATPPSDGAFCRFEDAKFGIRAMAKIIRNYGAAHNLRTLRQIISRWAPPNENDTNAYVAAVSRRIMRDADEALNLSDTRLLSGLCRALIVHENGACPYSDDEIRCGVESC